MSVREIAAKMGLRCQCYNYWGVSTAEFARHHECEHLGWVCDACDCAADDMRALMLGKLSKIHPLPLSTEKFYEVWDETNLELHRTPSYGESVKYVYKG